MIRLALGRMNADGTAQSDIDRTVAAKLGLEVFVSSDGGRSFVSAGDPHTECLLGGSTARSDGGVFPGEWCNVVAIDPFDPDRIIAGQQDLFLTEDGETKWRAIVPAGGGRTIHEDMQHVVFDRGLPGVAYIACDGGVYRYRDTRSPGWSEPPAVTERFDELNRGLSSTEFFRVGVRGEQAVGNADHNGLKGTFAVGPESAWRKANRRGGNNALEGSHVFADPVREGRFYIVNNSDGGRLHRLRFTDDDQNHLGLFGDFQPYDGNYRFADSSSTLSAVPFAIDRRPDSNIMIACAIAVPGGAGHRLMITNEADQEPVVTAGVLETPEWLVAFDHGSTDALVSTAFAPSAPSMAYAISDDGVVIVNEDVDINDVNVSGWETRSAWPCGTGVRQMAVNVEDASTIYAITADTFGRSVDGGQSWTCPDEQLPPPAYHSLAADPFNAERLYMGTDTGVYFSADDGGHWAPFDDGLPNTQVLQVFVESGYLYATTFGRGLWRRKLCD